MYLTDLNKQDMAALMDQWHQPRFRTDQVMAWLNKGARPEEMTNLPKSLRETLASSYLLTAPVPVRRQESQLDGTVKYLWQLHDGIADTQTLKRGSHIGKVLRGKTVV